MTTTTTAQPVAHTALATVPAAERRTPWNVMGGNLTREFSTVAEALEATGTDFQVEMAGAQAVLADGLILEAPNAQAVVRPAPKGATGHQVLAFTGKRFTPIQNRDAFAVADLLVAEFGSTIAGAADFRSGGASLLVVNLNRPVTLEGPGGVKDVTDLNLLIKNAHDGSSALTFALTGMRIACTNAVNAAVAGAKRTWKISHTPNAAQRVDLARQSIITAMTYQDEFQAKAQQMLDTAMVDAEFDKIVSRLWYVDPEKADTKAGERRLEIQAEVRTVYRNSETLDGVRGTRWGGYNAVTEWLDWARPVRGGTEEQRAVSRAEGSLEGAAVRTKARVWETFATV